MIIVYSTNSPVKVVVLNCTLPNGCNYRDQNSELNNHLNTRLERPIIEGMYLTD